MIFRRLILPYEWIVCQCYIRTTQSFDFLHSFMICRHCSDFRYTESQNFRILNCACVQNTKPNGKHKMKRRQKKITFCWLVTSLPSWGSHHYFRISFISKIKRYVQRWVKVREELVQIGLLEYEYEFSAKQWLCLIIHFKFQKIYLYNLFDY